MTKLRYATIADLPALLAIMEAAFAENPSEAHMSEMLRRERNRVWVVDEDGLALGFVAGFLSKVNRAIRRWEVDLLAVHPQAQGYGYGRELLKITLQDARDHRANFSRGLVRLDNKVAQNTFKMADFHTTGQIYNLYMWQPSDLGITPPNDDTIGVIHVETLTYKGIWLEGLSAPYLSLEDRVQYISGARTLAAQQNRTLVSSLVPVKHPLAPQCAEEATLIGQYQWWRRP